MATKELFDGEVAGGYNSFPDRVTKRIFYKKDIAPRTKPATIASGQVIAAYTFLESNAAGDLVVHGGISESAQVTFVSALTAGQTLIMAGLTFTAGASGTTVAQLALAWSNLGDGIADGTTAASLTNVTNASAGGTFTVGTLTGYEVVSEDANTVVFNSTTALTNVADVVATGLGAAAASIVITAGTATFNKIAGVTVYDVNATSGAVDAEVYSEASFWANDDGSDALRWSYDVGETITLADGSTVTLTAYNTGASGSSVASRKLKQKFVEGSNFEQIGFTNAGGKS